MATNIQTLVGQSTWNKAEQQLFLGMVPLLGPVFLAELSTRLQSASFEYESGIWLHTLEVCTGLVKGLQNKDTSALLVFSSSYEEPLLDFGKSLVPMAVDLLNGTVPNTPPLGNPDALVVAKFAIGFIELVPERALVWWVQNNLLRYFASFPLTQLFMKRKQADWAGIMEGWGEAYVLALKKNQELLGKQIIVGENVLAPTVEHWLSEYDVFAGKPSPQREAFERLRYIQENVNCKALSKDEQQVLLKLCELYDWFSDPYVAEAEEDELKSSSTEARTQANKSVAKVPAEDAPRQQSVAQQTEPSKSFQEDEVLIPEKPSVNIQGILSKNPVFPTQTAGLLEVEKDSGVPKAYVLPAAPEILTEEEKVYSLNTSKVTAPVAKEPKPTPQPPTKPQPKVAEQVSNALPPRIVPMRQPSGVSDKLDMAAVAQNAKQKELAMQAEVDKKLAALKRKSGQ